METIILEGIASTALFVAIIGSLVNGSLIICVLKKMKNRKRKKPLKDIGIFLGLWIVFIILAYVGFVFHSWNFNQEYVWFNYNIFQLISLVLILSIAVGTFTKFKNLVQNYNVGLLTVLNILIWFVVFFSAINPLLRIAYLDVLEKVAVVVIVVLGNLLVIDYLIRNFPKKACPT